MTLEFSIPYFLCVTLPINVFFADSLLLKSLPPLDKKQLSGSVLVFEQRNKQIQLNAAFE